MTKEELIKGYKENLEANCDGNYPMPMFGIECGNGWNDLLVPIFNCINEWNKTHHGDEQIHIHQIKEKFAGLRFYTSWETPELSKLIKEAEHIADKTCESCGAPGTTHGKSWWYISCESCETKRQIK